MANKELGIYRIEYEILPSLSSWTAFVVAHAPEEVPRYLEMLMGRGKINMTSIGYQCRVDGICPEARETITGVGARSVPKAKEVVMGKTAPAGEGENQPSEKVEKKGFPGKRK